MKPDHWTADSVARLFDDELRQLRENATALGAAEVVGLCDAALDERGTSVARRRPSRAMREKDSARLVPRRKAFEMRGVQLNAGMSSWGGVRSSDGMVVLSLWADDVRQEKGGCSCLLWAPNDAGARPWSDSVAGKERLQHCKLALERGQAEGFLVHGVRRDGFLPEERASTIQGADPHTRIAFHVVMRGPAYWAVWGSKAPA